MITRINDYAQITPAAVQLSKSNNHIQNPRACPQVYRKWLAIFYFVRRCSQVCLASVSQVMRRLHAGVRRSRNRRQFSQVYRKCIASVSQVYRRYVSTVPQLSRNSHKWINLHTIQLSVHMVWSVIITQFQCCKIFELKSFPFSSHTK